MAIQPHLGIKQQLFPKLDSLFTVETFKLCDPLSSLLYIKETSFRAMSFGFSVGDFISGASLAFKLYQSLSATKGSVKGYQELVTELNVVHKVLMQVDQLSL